MMIQLVTVFVFGLMLVVAMGLRSKQQTTTSPNAIKTDLQTVRPDMPNIFTKLVSSPQSQTVNHKPYERKQMRKAIRRACQTLSVSTKPNHVRERAKNFLHTLDDQWNGLVNDALCRVFKGGKEYSLGN